MSPPSPPPAPAACPPANNTLTEPGGVIAARLNLRLRCRYPDAAPREDTVKPLLASLLILLVPVAESRAQSAPSVASVAALRAGNFGAAKSLTLAGYYAGSAKGGGALLAVSTGA